MKTVFTVKSNINVHIFTMECSEDLKIYPYMWGEALINHAKFETHSSKDGYFTDGKMMDFFRFLH